MLIKIIIFEYNWNTSYFDFVQEILNVSLLFYFKHCHIINIITIKKKKEKEKKKEKRLKYFERYNIKKYYDKEESQHFSLDIFENFRIIEKKIS